MAATTTLLGLLTPTQGTLSGTWGDSVNYGISDYVDIAIAGTLSFSGDGAITLANTLGSASGNGITTTTAQYMVIRITGTQTVTKVITGPSYSKLYMVDHAGATSAVTFKAAGQTGVSIAVGEKAFVYYNGTDYVKVSTSVTSTGTVTSASVVSANGFAGTVATATTTPAITLTTSITGVLKGNGTAISAAVAGTDYLAPPSGTAILKANSGGALANATAGTDYLAPPSGTAILKANSGGALANATAGTDYVAPGTATTFTATQTFNGSSSTEAVILANASETVNIVAGTINANSTAYFNTGSVSYYTTSTTNNWTQNLTFSSGTTLDSALSTGQSLTLALLATNSGTAYYPTVFTIDGNSITPKWQGGTAPTSGNANSIDSYAYTVIKTGSATFVLLAAQTKFA
jgi:hypothetical protein